MRNTIDRGRAAQCASFVHDTHEGVMVQCPYCGEHQEVKDDFLALKPHLCTNTSSCGKEIFYPGWEKW